ncbi:hypothetical protein Shyhy01_75480 [Streptomyces hygroscopicus subsp. hygroscopicus]|nr:hypothetical protein Shyhy01_75480 [Streptomyces hygroscopicus subsp. hygroscopicus]
MQDALDGRAARLDGALMRFRGAGDPVGDGEHHAAGGLVCRRPSGVLTGLPVVTVLRAADRGETKREVVGGPAVALAVGEVEGVPVRRPGLELHPRDVHRDPLPRLRAGRWREGGTGQGGRVCGSR